MRFFLFLFFGGCVNCCFSQTIDSFISAAEAKRIIGVLASDSLKGRGNFSIELDKAANFITNEFKKSGLRPFNEYTFYKQPFLFYDRKLNNVIGYLPGKSKADEFVLISAHYDHVGWMHNRKPDSIFNGANDNASGTAAMIMLANYFSSVINERSILFVAFAGEELGLVGSYWLSSVLNSDSVIAVINLEMLGKAPAGDKRSCIVTGLGDIPKLFRKEAKKSGIKIRQDHYYNQNLFARSDNYPFSRYGIPAHTFMIFIENDPDYHQPSDEIETLDLENMAGIVKGLVKGLEELASGRFTPKRLIKLER